MAGVAAGARRGEQELQGRAEEPELPAEQLGLVERTREHERPFVDGEALVGERVEIDGILDEDYPDGWRYYWKSVDLEELGESALAAIAGAAERAPSHHSTIDVAGTTAARWTGSIPPRRRSVRGRASSSASRRTEGEELLRASYGERNYERLRAVEAEVDPAGVFRGPGAIGGERAA